MLLLAILAGCRSSQPPTTQPPSTQPPATPAHLKLRDLSDAVVQLRATEPSLRGFKDYEVISANALRGRSQPDAALLIGRLYYDMLQKLESSTPPSLPSENLRTAVREELGKPGPVERFSKQYFDELLNDTKVRAVRDRDFGVAVDNSSKWAAYRWQSEWDTYQCFIDGFSFPSWMCRLVVTSGIFETLTVIDF